MPLPDNAVDNAVAKLDGMVDDLMKKSGIPGMAVAVVHGGKTVYAKGFGVKDVRSGDKIDPDTVFQLASLSKSLSATVVAQQVGANAIGWDTPIVSKLPWFALSDPVVTRMVSVGDMFSHRSGLPDHAGDMLEDLGYDRRYVLERLRQLPLDPFRISYAYTNFGLTAGAEAVAGERRQVLGGPRRRGAVPSARHGVDELSVRRLRRPGRTARSAISTSTVATNRSTSATPTPRRPQAGPVPR